MTKHYTFDWYAIRCRPGAEYLAVSEMGRVSISAYLPQYRHEYRHHRTKAWITRAFPLFTGYAFALAAPEFPWAALNVCDGVMREGALSDSDGKPVKVSAADIAAIRAAVERGEFDRLRDHSTRLRDGEAVAIAEGALQGIDAVVSGEASVNRVRVLLKMFNAEVVATGRVAKVAKKE